PIISAVGHQKDFTLADLVADLRAATPSQAAELVIPKKEDLKEKVEKSTQRLRQAILNILWDFSEQMNDFSYHLQVIFNHLLEIKENRLESLIKKISLLNPLALVNQYREKNQKIQRDLNFRIKNILEFKEGELKNLTEKLTTLNPLNILRRGYSITFRIPQETLLKDTQGLTCGELIKTKLYKGEIVSKIIKIDKEGD
ncbi:MAG: hypothetical protein N2Z79_01970, partial [Candidatus Omnitrophica bacterium]|nr:hypothetical protein [Candidatus Omnitrophota bacterium]